MPKIIIEGDFKVRGAIPGIELLSQPLKLLVLESQECPYSCMRIKQVTCKLKQKGERK